ATAADRQLARVLPTLRPIDPEGPLAGRVAAYAAQTCGLYARVAPVSRAALPKAERDELCAALVAATSFSTWEELATHQGLSQAAVGRVVRRTVGALL